jgi:hypothetical protein
LAQEIELMPIMEAVKVEDYLELPYTIEVQQQH